ncbi:MAG: carbamoyltransferase HypF [Planctomycetes bacterium]|uniref:carbamoyltransferase HypF n=1 Tax=Candidatus Wunengus sp. YC65 TaxID=3367701 RepID=UPI001DE3E589|nr:carbamoyltransferase HypF [Planctomycetota bacterium]
MQISANGVVQGVGFRPYIYNLATKFSLSGFVQNDSSGVFIDVEGCDSSVDEFLTCLAKSPPPHAIIENIHYTTLPPKGYKSFIIEESAIKENNTTMICADIATCPDCLKELFDPGDHRYHYPFINCTNCGPRFTIVKDIPYDRANTTMSDFRMCHDCSSEYHDPKNRRFHAQPNACPVCGPQLMLLNNEGFAVQTQDPISTVCTLLHDGKIFAVKGLGGYHIACDALNSKSVFLLRKRKYREDKPFAVMMENIETVNKFCFVNAKEETLLFSTQRPIVLLKKKSNCTIPHDIAPDNLYLGVMLPYTPLHHLIIRESGLPLVMTSGNVSDEPIAYKDNESLERLKGIADYFLVHDRDIFMRCDDSVVKVVEDKAMIIRRSRGYAPFPLRLQYAFTKPVLACGAFLKNTFCLARGNHAFLSHHIGDLENTETMNSYETAIEHYKRLFSIEPAVIAYDFHPEYLSTKYALAQNDDILKIGVQHHHAHIVSCMAENGIHHKVIGVAFDGLGYGDDGKFWGGEFLITDFSEYERAGHLEYVPMPGGEQAIKEPWRMAISYLYQIYGNDIPSIITPLTPHFTGETKTTLDHPKIKVLLKMLSQRIHCPLTSSMGRLFDGVASLLDLQHSVNYEGQAAIKLESIADEHIIEHYPFDIDVSAGARCSVPFIIQWHPIIKHILADVQCKVASPIISARFHNSIVDMVYQVCIILRDSKGINDVVLSGGVFQNKFLFKRLLNKLSSQNFNVYFHKKVPCNDGGISLGQAVIAGERLKTCV